MAFKLHSGTQLGGSTRVPGAGRAYLPAWIHVQRAGKLLPATTTEILFLVGRGRVLVHYMQGLVTVVCDSTNPVAKITSAKLDSDPWQANGEWAAPKGAAVVGTAVDVASTTTMASKEVGSMVNVLGSGAALVVNNAGAGLSTLGRNEWIAPRGEIYLTTGGTNLTGFVQWDIWYTPLENEAFIVPVNTATAKI